tara:strand:- start:855 stop:1913 length:1059 start_codon:yes stop_codon:yes gene_type:complete
MSKKTTTLVWYSAIPLWLLISLTCKNPDIVEKYYSRIFYPLIFDLHQFFMDLIPFSFGDILYVFLTFFVLRTIFKKMHYWQVKPMNLFLDLGSLLILVVWIFHISWGFNYHRLPLSEQLQIPISYTEEDLENRLDKIIEESNQWHNSLVCSDTIAVTFPFSKEQLLQKISLYHPIYNETLVGSSKVKNSLMSLPLSYMGYSGYLNPFTLESQVNVKMPIQSLITTSLHEMAHQLGYASEKEANFIAYLSAITSKDPYIQYAGKTFAYRYLFSDLFKLNPEKARGKLKLLNPGILKNFKEVNDFWKKYENPFEIIFDKTYDSYLKANGQKSGIESYSKMVGLMINYHKNEKQF